MNAFFSPWVQHFARTDDLRADMIAFLRQWTASPEHDFSHTAEHCLNVGAQARKLATAFSAATVNINPTQAEHGGWLHDISAPIPNMQRVEAARQLGIEVLPEEEYVPMLLHQKLSAAFAREVFGVADNAVLSAIGCHTTLKANASLLDKIVFLADKIAWDQPDKPPYLDDVLAGLNESLDRACWVYLDYLWQRRHTLPAVHPWMVKAYAQLTI